MAKPIGSVLAIAGIIGIAGYYFYSKQNGEHQINNGDPNTTSTSGSASGNLEGLVITTAGTVAQPNTTTYNITYNVDAGADLPAGLFGASQQQDTSKNNQTQTNSGNVVATPNTVYDQFGQGISTADPAAYTSTGKYTAAPVTKKEIAASVTASPSTTDVFGQFGFAASGTFFNQKQAAAKNTAEPIKNLFGQIGVK